MEVGLAASFGVAPSTDYFVPDAAGGVFGLAGSPHSILQLGRAFCSAATDNGVILNSEITSVFNSLHSASGERSVILVLRQFNEVSGIPANEDKFSIPLLSKHERIVRAMPERGPRSVTLVPVDSQFGKRRVFQRSKIIYGSISTIKIRQRQSPKR